MVEGGEEPIVKRRRHAPPTKIKGNFARTGDEQTHVLDDFIADEPKILELKSWISKLDDEDAGELTEFFN